MPSSRKLLISGVIAASCFSSAPCFADSSCVLSRLGHPLIDTSSAVVASPSPEFTRLQSILSKLRPDGIKSGKKVKVIMAAVELGEVPGLTNIAAGGVSTVMNDITRYYPEFLKSKAHGEVSIVGLLMDGVSKEKLTPLPSLKIKVDSQDWDVGVYQYKAPNGVKYYFFNNPRFKRLTVTPARGQSVYSFRGFDDKTPEGELQTQRIWSAFNQAVSKVFQQEKGDIYVPHDYHASPASFYIRRESARGSLAAKPLVHNERYVGHFDTKGRTEETRNIWNLTDAELRQYFMHGDHLLMLAPAVRVAEQGEIFTAMSVADGSAQSINRQTKAWPDFFGRVQGVTNGMGEENRPFLSKLLSPGTYTQIKADGITNSTVISHFKTKGYAFGFKWQKTEEVLAAKGRAKADFQRNMGLAVDADRPLFVGFARMVHQKGMVFVAQNVRHILDQGGQVVVGGPVGDAFGEAERKAFLEIKAQLIAEGHPGARDFVFIDGAVKGRLKGLMLAGGDFFLIPSRFEPCGLTDCEALMHGTIALAHDTGGLNKGKNTLLYSPVHEDDQGWALGEGVKQAISLFRDREGFQARQLAAMKEDFSVETNFDKFAQTYRVEVYGKMVLELEALVRNRELSEATAEKALRAELDRAGPGDLQELAKGLAMMHPNRRTSLMSWILDNLASR